MQGQVLPPVPQGDPAEGRRSDFNGGRNDFSGRWNTETHQETKSAGEAVKTPKTANADFTGYYQECRERLTDPAAVAYLQRRGIDPATAAAYWIGFDPAADPANAPGAGADTKKPHPCPRLIVPTSAGHYIARRIDGQKEFEKLNPAGNLPRQVLDAAQEYKEAVADRISIVEGNFSCNISFIGDYIRQYIRRTGTRLYRLFANPATGSGYAAAEYQRNGNPAKLDLRIWRTDEEPAKPGKGITLRKR